MKRSSGRILDALKKDGECISVVFAPDFAEGRDVLLSDLACNLGWDTGRLRDRLRSLEQEGYICKVELPRSGTCVGYSLTDKGAIWREQVRKERIHYLLEKWIDIAALLISVAALSISIISLLLGQRPQP